MSPYFYNLFSKATLDKLSDRQLTLFSILSLALINIFVFWNHYIGQAIFPWDFLGGYHAMPFSWYRDGSWLSPPFWNNYGNYGFPWHLALQSSSYYLPIQLIELLDIPYTYNTAARLQTLHILFGSIGCFFLCRQQGVSFLASLFSALVFHFSIGFYGNAQHIDIVRAYAFTPWVFFLLSSSFLSNLRCASIAAVVVSSFVVASYPGAIVALTFIFPIYVVYSIVFVNRQLSSRYYFLLLIFTLVTSICLIAIKYGPVLSYLDQLPEVKGRIRVLEAYNYFTFLFRFDVDLLRGDLSMRSYFLPVTALIMLFFIGKPSRQVLLWLAILVVALFLVTINSPVRHVFESLPGFNSSRFHISDYRGIVHLSISLLAGLALHKVCFSPPSLVTRTLQLSAALAVFAITVKMAINVGYEWKQIHVETIIGFSFIVTTAAILILKKSYLLSCITLVFTVISGVQYINHEPKVWAYSDYEKRLETRIFRTSLSSLFHSREIVQESEQRDARFYIRNKVSGNLGYYNQSFSQTGYDNGLRLKTNSMLKKVMANDSSQRLLNFMNKESSFVFLPELTHNFDDLWQEQSSGLVSIELRNFGLNGSEFNVILTNPIWLIENELYFDGWKANICSYDGMCSDEIKAVPFGGLLRAWKLPVGNYSLYTRFEPLGWGYSKMIFVIGCLLLIFGFFADKIIGLARFLNRK